MNNQKQPENNLIKNHLRKVNLKTAVNLYATPNQELEVAIRTKNLERIKQILSRTAPEMRADINHENLPMRETPLFNAIKMGEIPIIECLLEHGANLEAKNANRKTPLAMAVDLENLPVVQYLIEKGADIHTKDANDRNLLHYAASKNNIPLLRYILTLNLDIEVEECFHRTAFFLAVEKQNMAIMDILYQHGANINNGRDSFGNPPLTHAIFKQKNEVAEKLLEMGADITKTNTSGLNAFESDFHNNDQKFLNYFLKNWREKNKNQLPNGLKKLQKDNQALLQYLLVTGKLLTEIKEQPYEQQVETYKIIKNILPPEHKKDFETAIRENRKKQGRV